MPHKEASCKPERRRGLPQIMSDAREAKIATSHYDSSMAQRTSVTQHLVVTFFIMIGGKNMCLDNFPRRMKVTLHSFEEQDFGSKYLRSVFLRTLRNWMLKSDAK